MEYFNNPTYPPPEESEDCLYLNVYTPPGVTTSSKKAVMFWLFGVRVVLFSISCNDIDQCRVTSLLVLAD
jgi:hypothetical protein